MGFGIAYSGYRTDWSGFVFDRAPGPNILDIHSLQFPVKIPIGEQDFQSILSAANIMPTAVIKVANYSRSFTPNTEQNFAEQMSQILQLNIAEGGDFEKQAYIVYFDIPRSQLENIYRPHLFFHRIAEFEWGVFANQTQLRKGDSRDKFIAIELPKIESEMLRVTFKFIARHSNRLPGIYFTHGLTIRSADEAGWALQNLPAQHQYPRLFATVFLFVFSLIGLVMALSTPQYRDIWAYSAFCGSLAALLISA
jgi:hypothetical protein